MPGLSKAEIERRADLIVREWDGIAAPFEAFYLQSIIYSASRAADAFQRYDVARAVRDTEANQVSAVHEALGHAASLSRFFWPSGLGPRAGTPLGRLKDARSTKLRRAFDLTDESPLRDRNLRDALEHLDERLDSYCLANDSGYFFPSARVADIELAREPDGHFFRLVDPAQSRFACLGVEHCFGPVRSEVTRVLELAGAFDKAGSRLPRDASRHSGT